MTNPALTTKSTAAMKTISEVAGILDLPTHVLRFWETKFSQIQPLKRGGGRRFYRPEDIDALLLIKELLHQRNYTIKGAAKVLPDLLKNRSRAIPVTIPEMPAAAPSMNRLTRIEGIAPSEDMHLSAPRKQALLALKRELEAIRAMLAA